MSILSRLKNRKELNRLMEEGHRLHAEGRNARAIASYRKAAELALDRPAPHRSCTDG